MGPVRQFLFALQASLLNDSFDAAVAALDGPKRRAREARRCLKLRLLGSHALDRLSQSTRGRLSVSSGADLLEPQEVHERRDRLDNVGRWALVTALHEGSLRDNARSSALSRCPCPRAGSGRCSPADSSGPPWKGGRSASVASLALSPRCRDRGLRVVDVESGVCVQGVRVVHERAHASEGCKSL